MLAGNLMAGWQLGRAALAAQEQLNAGDGDVQFLQAKLATARFYAEHILVRAPGLRDAIIDGAQSVVALELEAY
jgi:hypothetical protein